MRISRSTGYALLSVNCIIKRKDQKVVLSQEIAEEYDIPLDYLLKILQQLVKANVLRSKRGPGGGYSLSRPANKITLLDVIEAVNGPMVGKLNLAEQAPGERFGIKAEQAYEKAIVQAKNVFEKTNFSALSGK